MIAITGASGFVGSALTGHLRAQGLPVRRLLRTATGSSQDHGVGDIGPDTDWRIALHGVNCVIHCAARVHVMTDTATDPLTAYRRVNALGTQCLAEQAAASGVRRLVYLSSIKVLGEETPAGHPFTEHSVAQPLDPYGQSKWEAEQALHAVALRTGLQVVIVRPPLVYGPGVGANFRALLRAVARGWPLPLGRIQNRRSLVGLGNLVHLLTLCASHPAAAGQTFLVSDGDDLSTPELVRQMALALNTAPHLWPVPVGFLHGVGRLAGRSDQVRRVTESLQIDMGHTQRTLHWQPPFTVADELARTAKHLPSP